MRFRSILLGFLATLLLIGCTAPDQPDLAALTPTRLLSFSPDGRYIVYFAEDQGRDIGGFQIPGWYVLHDLFTGKNYPLHGEGSWYRNAVVWLKNGNVGLDLDSGVVIADREGKVRKRWLKKDHTQHALRSTGELLIIPEKENEEMALWNPVTGKRRLLHITWDGKELSDMLGPVWSEKGDKFAAIGNDDVVLVVVDGEREQEVGAKGTHLPVRFHLEGNAETGEDGLWPFFETDAPCHLWWKSDGKTLGIPCQDNEEVSFDVQQGTLIRRKPEPWPFPPGVLMAPDNVRGAIIENGTIVVKHKSEF